MQNLSTIGLPFGKVTKWLTTHVDSVTGHIFCQLSEPSISVKYERLYQAINGWGKAGRLSKLAVSPQIGDLCLTKLPRDKKWYRSQITHVNSTDNEVEVYILDYGYSVYASFNDLYDLPSQFVEVLPHAYECLLAEVEPILNSDKWSERAIELINELVLEQELPGIPVRLHRNILVLKLYADLDARVTVANQLISAGFGQEKAVHNTNGSVTNSVANSIVNGVRSNSVSSGESTTSSKKSSSSSTSFTFKKFQFVEEQYLDLCVVFCESISKFFCQPISATNELIMLQENIQKQYSKATQSPIKCKLNQPCCAKFDEDSMWYRGIVKRIGSDSCLVYFVDYGNTASIVHSDIKELSCDFFTLPIMAIECSLNGIIPLQGELSFSEKSKEIFESLTLDNKSMVGFVAKIVSGKADIILYDKDDQSINKKLVQNGLVMSSSSRKSSKVGSVRSVDVSTHSAVNENLVAVKYVDISFRTGQEETCYVTFTYEPNYFYINLLNSKNSLDQLMADIAAHTENKELSQMPNPEIGFPCLIMYSEDNCYYRGEIIGINGNEAEVFFVDYGNKESKQIKELKTIMKEFIKLPKQAIQCKLNGISPIDGVYGGKACEKFEELTLDKNLLMTVSNVSNGTLTIDLVEENTNNAVPRLNIANAMISSGVVITGKTPYMKVDYGAMITSDTVSYKELDIDLNCYLDVAPVDVQDPAQFCCHVVQNAVDFKKMTEDINEYYAQSAVNQNMVWKKMMPCIALYDEDECWYRALIIGCLRDQTFEVNFVDFGNSAVVSITNLRPIYQDFMTLPAQVFVCAIADISPKDKSWSNQAIEGFQNFVKDKHLTAYIKSKGESNLYTVVLYDTRNSPEVNIAQWLIQMNHAVSTEISVLPKCSLNVEREENEAVHVSAVKNPGEFWVQLDRFSAELDEMMEKLYNFYSPLKPTDLSVVHPIIGQYCCALFTEDEGWYRAIIEEVHGKSIHVKYIDYGNSETVTTDSVKVLTTDFDSYPSYALQCHLSGLESYPSWAKSVNSLLLDKSFNARFLNNGTPAEVELYADEKNVSDEIKAAAGVSTPVVKNEPAVMPSKDIVIKECDFKVGDRIQVTLLHVSSPLDFYCQLLDTKKEFDAMETEITKLVRVGGSGMFNGGIGSFCLAMSSELKKWCRAEIFDVSGKMVSVQFVDFGNEETVERNSIKPLPAQFASLKKQAVLCSLSYLKPAGSEWSNGANELLQSLWFNKTIALDVEGNVDGKIDIRPSVNDQVDDIGKRLVDAGLAKLNSSAGTFSSEVESKAIYAYPVVAEKETGYVTFIHSAVKISVQLQKHEDGVNKVMEKLATCCANANSLKNASPGSVCAALFSDDNTWYRALVTNINGRAAKVLFIDYGNEEAVDTSQLKELPSSALEVPRTCISCYLHDVHEADIDLAGSKNWLEENLMNQLVTIDLVGSINNETSSVPGIVYIEEGNTINDQLYVNFELEVPIESKAVEAISVKEVPTIPKAYDTYDIPIGTSSKAYCTYVDSVNKCLQLQLSVFGEQLTALMEEISTFCQTTPETYPSIAIGMPCLSLFSDDQSWYRAEVIEIKGEEVTVFFVDYGNTDTVKPSQIYRIPDNFFRLPKTCVPYSLSGIKSIYSKFDDVEDYLEELIDVELDLTVHRVSAGGLISGDVHCPTIFPSTLLRAVCEKFNMEMDEEVANSSDVVAATAPVVLPADKPPITTSKESSAAEGVESGLSYAQPEISSTEGGYCTVIHSATRLGIQLKKYEDGLNSMMENLSNHCANAGKATNVVVGAVCAALYSLDEGWYRAEVICLDRENASVYFVDYGNTETVALTNLRDLPAECLALPRACFLCDLLDVHPEDLDVSGVVPWLQEHVNEQAVNITDLVKNEDGDYVGYIYVNDSETHVNDLLYANFALEEVVEVVPVVTPKLNVEMGDELANSSDVVAATAPVVSSAEKPSSSSSSKEASVAGSVDESGLSYAQPEISSTEGGYCTFIHSATRLCIQLKKYEDDLNSMMENLSNHCASAGEATNVVVGAACAALYSLDGGWYRAEVVSLDGENATVYFVDYGNTEAVALNNLRELSSECLTLPRACFLCNLLDVHSEDLDVSGILPWLQEHVNEQAVNITDLVRNEDGGDYVGYIYINDLETHVNDLLYANFALEEVEEVVPVVTPETVKAAPVEHEEIIEKVAGINLSESQICAPELASNQRYTATCFVVESAVTMKCQLGSYSEQLDGLMVNIAASAEKAAVVENVQVGQLCLAKYSVDEGWYRGRIIADGSVEFIDYGNGEKVSPENIRVIAAEFTSLPQTCISVTLHDVHLPDIDVEKTKSWIEENVLEQEINLEVLTILDTCSIDAYVFVGGSEINVNDQIYELFAMAQEGTVVEGPPNKIQEVNEDVAITEDAVHQDQVKIVEISPPELFEGSRYPTTCFVVESAVAVKCQVSSYQEQLDELMNNIAVAAEGANVLENVAPGQLCLAKYSVDDGWYRGRILNDGSVEFIDYGNGEKVPQSNIRVIAPEFTTLPQTCITVTLHDVHVTDIDVVQAKSWLDENLLEQPVNVEVVGIADSRAIEAYLYKDDNEVSINDQMYELFSMEVEVSEETDCVVEPVSVRGDQDLASTAGESVKQVVASVVSQVPPPELTAGTIYQATCFVVESAVVLKCQLGSYSEQLGALMERIATSADEAAVIEDIEVGQLCLAQYSLDEGWYRGRYLDNGRVEFIDYGNGEIVPPTKIRVISPEFMSLPQTCITVTLHDVHLPDIDIAKTKPWIEQSFLDQPVNVEVVSITDQFSIEAYVYLDTSETQINDQIYELFSVAVDDVATMVEKEELKGLPVEDGENKSVSQDVIDQLVTDTLGEENRGVSKDVMNKLVNDTVEHAVSADVKVAEMTDQNVGMVEIHSPELFESTRYQTTCFVVESAVALKCQFSSYQKQLDDLMNNIAVAAEGAKVIENLAPGQLCLAKYSVDECWYRGRILSDGSVEFFDYGNGEKVPESNIRVIAPEFTTLPQTCITVTLHDVHVTDIDVTKAKSWLDENVLEQEVKVEVVSIENPRSIEAYVYLADNEINLNDQMYEWFAIEPEAALDEVKRQPVNVIAQEESRDVVAEVTVADPEVAKSATENILVSSASELPPPEIVENSSCAATCFVVESSLIIKCQLLSYIEHLDELMVKIAAFADKAEMIGSPQVGQLCLAKFSVDEGWYRARVLSDGSVEFIDYGNGEKVSPADMRIIPPEFLLLPQTCISVTLHDVHMADFDITRVKTWLDETLIEQEVKLEVVSIMDPCSVEAYVYLSDAQIHINDQIYELFATGADGEPNAVLGEVVDQIVQGDQRQDECVQSDCTQLVIPSLELCANTVYRAICYHVESAEKLRFQLLTYEEELKDLMNKMILNVDKAAVIKPVAGQLCLTKHSRADGWYRGRVLENEKIEYLDYGNIDGICGEIRELLPEFMLLPQSSVSIFLHDVHVVDIDTEATKAWLTDRLLERVVKVEVVDILESSIASAYVYLDGSETHVNDEIYENFVVELEEVENGVPVKAPIEVVECDELEEAISGNNTDLIMNSSEIEKNVDGLASGEVMVNGDFNISSFSCETFSWPLLTVGGKEDVVFTVVDNATTLRCQMFKYREKLERLMKTISDEVENQPSVRFLEKGDACIAQWEDLNWYRARVLSSQESTVKVEFVDYGNVDDIITEDLRVMKPEMLSDHVFCLKCVLNHVHIAEENEEDAIEYLSQTLVEDSPVVSILINDVDYEDETAMVTIIQDGVNINEFIQKTYGPLENVFREREVVLGEKMRLTPMHATTLSDFACRYCDTRKELESLMQKLREHYGNEGNRETLTTLEVDSPCCVFRVTDNSWYRGLVAEIGAGVSIRFVDYGFCEDVTATNIYKLETFFFQLGIQSIKCRLFNLLPVKDFEAWAVEAVDYFNEICHDQVLTATVINNTDDLYSVALAFENGETVYELLTKKKLALGIGE